MRRHRRLGRPPQPRFQLKPEGTSTCTFLTLALGPTVTLGPTLALGLALIFALALSLALSRRTSLALPQVRRAPGGASDADRTPMCLVPRLLPCAPRLQPCAPRLHPGVSQVRRARGSLHAAEQSALRGGAGAREAPASWRHSSLP